MCFLFSLSVLWLLSSLLSSVFPCVVCILSAPCAVTPHDGRVLWCLCAVFCRLCHLYQGYCNLQWPCCAIEVTIALLSVTKDVPALSRGGPLSCWVISVFIPRGAVDTRLEPWTRCTAVSLLALSSGAPCSTVWCARKQQSLPT